MRVSRRHLLILPVAGSLFGQYTPSVRLPAGTGRAEAPVPPAFGLVPLTARDDDSAPGVIVDFADIALEMAHTGVVRPASLNEDDPDRGAFLRMLTPVSTTGATVIQYALAEDWRELHGFDIRDIDQIVQYGTPPDRVTILRGRFDLDGIRAALTVQGYESIDVGDVEVMNGGDDYSFDLDPATISRFWLGQAQNVVFIDDQTLVFAAASGLVESVIRVRAGDDASLLADDRLAALFPESTDPLATSILLDGRGLSAERFVRAEVTDEHDVSPLPRIEAAVFGSTPGGVVIGPDEDRAPSVDYVIGETQIRVLFADAGAATEGRTVITARLADGSSFAVGQPWSEVFGETDVEQFDGSPLVIIHIPEWIPGQRSVTNLVYQDDFGFLIWG